MMTTRTRPQVRVRPALRTERLAAPVMAFGFILALIAGLSMDAAPLGYGPLIALMFLGGLVVLVGIRLSGEPLSEYVDLGGDS